MAVAAVAAVVDVFVVGVGLGIKDPFLVQKQRPQVVFQVEGGLAAFRLVFLEFLPAQLHHMAVLRRGAAHVPVLLRRAVACKGEDIGLVPDHLVHQRGDVLHVPAGDGGHDGHIDAGLPQQGDGRHGGVIGTRLLPDAVVGLAQAVQGQLVLSAAAVFQLAADFRRQMEGVAHQGKGDPGELEDLEQRPELRVQDGVAPCDVEVGQAAGLLAEGFAVFDHRHHVLQRHLLEFGVAAQSIDVAVAAPLVAGLCDMPLKCEILHRNFSFRGGGSNRG